MMIFFEIQVNLGGFPGTVQILHRTRKAYSVGFLLSAVRYGICQLFCRPCLGEPILPQITQEAGGERETKEYLGPELQSCGNSPGPGAQSPPAG